MTEFEEYLRGTFEINNGIENDVDTLVRIHAPELLKLAKKELMKKACFWLECNLSLLSPEDAKFWVEDFVQTMNA